MAKLNSDNLKNTLWETLQELRTKRVTPEIANAVASQSREIMRVVKIELTIAHAQNRRPTRNLIGG